MDVSEYESTVESEVDLYDSDVLAIKQVVGVLSEAVGTHRSLEGFRREIIERFGDIGFLVDVRVFEAEVEATADKVFFFKVVLTGRETKEAFDHEKMASEVRSDLLHGGKDATRRTASGLYLPA